ncbi:hypothetical protein GBAR_LOCUS2929 [Geodia barretti]|uniref:Uncharacterized protein n=1 Tax=Geodia barretti TaxID=519541 RepID=A0AA35R2J3_GEOBA|nr:hypothetical protein GBAR_LOCUS2929 [Geodia barretti]
MNGAGCRHWWRSSQGRFAAICLLSLATAAEASGGPCDSEVWSNSKCCRERNGLTIGGVTEDVLSVIDCDSSVEGTHLVQLDWHHSTLYEENHKLDRIFLFSHCINPTNTSLAPSMSTLLFSSDRTHLASSTTLSYPVASSCTYFGCYGANRGYNFYTFQEVSCTATAISSTADMILSTPIIYLVESTNLPVSPTLGGGQKPTPSPTTTQLAVTSTSSHEGVGLPRSTVITSQSIGKQTPSSTILTPTPSGPTSSQRSETVPFWAWALGTSLLLLVAAFAAAGSYLYVTQVVIGRPRDIRKNMKDLSWYADPWTGASVRITIFFSSHIVFPS